MRCARCTEHRSINPTVYSHCNNVCCSTSRIQVWASIAECSNASSDKRHARMRVHFRLWIIILSPWITWVMWVCACVWVHASATLIAYILFSLFFNCKHRYGWFAHLAVDSRNLIARTRAHTTALSFHSNHKYREKNHVWEIKWSTQRYPRPKREW